MAEDREDSQRFKKGKQEGAMYSIQIQNCYFSKRLEADWTRQIPEHLKNLGPTYLTNSSDKEIPAVLFISLISMYVDSRTGSHKRHALT